MSFTVLWSPEAKDDLSSLPSSIARRIVTKVETAKDDPLRVFARMTAAKVWRLRVGDYRVLADLDLAGRSIRVLRIGHRKNVYER